MKNTGMFRSAFIALFVGLIGAATMFAQPGNRGEGRQQAKDKMAKALEKLDLTDQQKEQIQALKDQFMEENAAAIEQIKELSQQAREQAKSGDREAAKATRDQIKEVRGSLKDDRQELHEQISAILTDEQKAQMKEMRDRRGKGRKGREKGQDRGRRDRAQNDAGSSTIE